LEFDVEKTIAYWLEGADYDLGVAEAMFRAKKYPYALFMGHLALEKLLKALVVKNTGQHAPLTHSLPILAERSGVPMPATVRVRLQEFMEFHFEARYPREERTFYEKCTRAYSSKMLARIKQVFQWLRKRL